MHRNRQAAMAATAFLVAALGGCAGGTGANSLPSGKAAYATIEENTIWPNEDLLRIGDHLSICVLGEPELTSDAYVVDFGRQRADPACRSGACRGAQPGRSAG